MGKQLVWATLLAGTALQAQSVAPLPTATPGAAVGGIAWDSAKIPPPVRAFVAASDKLIPQIATGSDGNGGGFFMTFEVFNLTDQPADVTVGFFDEQAMPMTLPMGSPPGDFTGFHGTVQPGGSLLAQTSPTGPVKIGYAFVDAPADSSGLGSAVAVIAIFNQMVTGRPIFQAGIDLSTALHDRFFVPFLNTAGFTGTLALVNVVPQRVTFIAHNPTGTELCRSSRLMGQGEHTAFVVRDQLPCTANQNGVLEVRGEAPGMAAVGFLAQDSGAFVTQTVYGMLPKQ